MKIKLSKSQWESIGKTAGWMGNTNLDQRVRNKWENEDQFSMNERVMSWDDSQESNSVKSQKWWGSLSINQMKELTRKYYPDPHITWSFINQTPGLVEDIYKKENGGV